MFFYVIAEDQLIVRINTNFVYPLNAMQLICIAFFFA